MLSWILGQQSLCTFVFVLAMVVISAIWCFFWLVVRFVVKGLRFTLFARCGLALSRVFSCSSVLWFSFVM